MKGKVPGFRFDARRKRATFEVTFPHTGGRKRRRTTVHAETRDKALAEWKKFRADVLGAKPSAAPTLQEYFDTVWARTLSRLSEKTRKRESWILRGCLLPRLASFPLGTIRDATVRDLVGELVSEKYAPATVNGIIALLGKILRDAWDRELIPAVPIHRLPRLRVERLRLEFAPEEQVRFLAAFDNFSGFQLDLVKSRVVSEPAESRFFSGPRRFGGSLRLDGEAAAYLFQQFRRSKPIFVIALESGLTRGDLLGLLWTSVNFRDGFIRVKRQKTGVEAVIPISRACREALGECRSRRVVGEHVFLTEGGRPYSVSVVTRYFQRAKRIAGIKRRFRFNDLRHTFASNLSSRGVANQLIAKSLGHTSARMTEGYARPSEAALEIVRKALDTPPTSETGSSATRPEKSQSSQET